MITVDTGLGMVKLAVRVCHFAAEFAAMANFKFIGKASRTNLILYQALYISIVLLECVAVFILIHSARENVAARVQ